MRHKKYPHFKKRYALCCTYFIKLCVNLCQFHNLNSGIGVEFQGTHRSLRISVIDSFQYNGIKTLIMSNAINIFMASCLDCYTPFDSHIFMEIISSNSQGNTQPNLVFHIVIYVYINFEFLGHKTPLVRSWPIYIKLHKNHNKTTQ